jgi:hypothetical protein
MSRRLALQGALVLTTAAFVAAPVAQGANRAGAPATGIGDTMVAPFAQTGEYGTFVSTLARAQTRDDFVIGHSGLHPPGNTPVVIPPPPCGVFC